MKLLRGGSWWMRSEEDPRWNLSGRANVGMFGMPSECERAIESKKKRYGEAPKDLKWGYMKD